MEYDIEYSKKEATEMYNNDKDAIELFRVMDAMYHGEISLSKDLTDIADLRLIKDSAPHDALHNAAIALTNSTVKYKVLTFGDTADEYQRANIIEQVLGFNWKLADRRPSGSTVLYNLFHSALRYDNTIVGVEDLYRWLPSDRTKWSKANRRAARLGRFVVTAYHPSGMHTKTSASGGLFKVLATRNMLLSEALDYYESLAGTDKIGRAMLAEISRIKDKFGTSYSTERIVICDMMDDDYRRIWGTCVGSQTIIDEGSIAKGEYTFMDTENPLPFLPWAMRGGASDMETSTKYKYHPMLAAAHWFDAWQNSTLGRSLIMSEALRRIREVRGVYVGNGTEDVAPDDLTGGDKALPPNVDFKRIPPSQMDPQAVAVTQQLKGELSQMTGSTILGNIGSYASSSTPFSTLNAVVQVEYGKLNPQKRIVQHIVSDVGYLMGEWAKFTGTPLQAVVSDTGTTFVRGQELQLGPNDYDLDRLFIECVIEPERPTDESQRIQNERWLIEMGKSQEKALEDLGEPNPVLELKKREEEKLREGRIAAENARVQQEAVLSAQAAVQPQMQNQQQNPQMPSQTQGLSTGQGQAVIQGAPGIGGGQAQNSNPFGG